MLSKLIVSDSKPLKICGVCGDRAKSYHFGGISCDSCKAFFRRSVQNDAYKSFQCVFQGKCDITMANRKCCQYCRFQKCLDIGMEISWVMTEEERVHMLRARMEKRQKGPQHPLFHSNPCHHPTHPQRFSPPSSPEEPLGAEYQPPPAKQPRHLDDSKIGSDSRQPVPIMLTGCRGNSAGNDYAGFENLSTEESLEIEKIVNHFQVWFKPSKGSSERMKKCSKWMLLVIFMVSIQKLVRFARGIDMFSCLAPSHQIGLLRANIFEMFLVIHFSELSSCLFSVDLSPPARDPSGSYTPSFAERGGKSDGGGGGEKMSKEKSREAASPAEEEKLDGADEKVAWPKCPFLMAGDGGSGGGSADEGSLPWMDSSFCAIFREVVKDTETLVLLLMVILFCSDSTELTDSRSIESRQMHFCALLTKYLGTHFSAKEGHHSLLLPKLLLLLPTLREIREKHVTYHFDLQDGDMDIAQQLMLSSIEKDLVNSAFLSDADTFALS